MINFNINLSYLELYLIVVNLISFLFYAYDKLQALKNSHKITRVSERALLVSSLIGGSLGSLLSMFLFRHKIKKVSFIVKFIIVVLIQGVSIYFYMKM